MSFDLDTLRQHIPYYLTAKDKEVLLAELRAIQAGDHVDFVLSKYYDNFSDVMLQGDGWNDFQLYVFKTRELRPVKGIVLSNSCDVDPANPRDIPSRVIFAPLVKLAQYQALLEQSGIPRKNVDQKIQSIKQQQTTNIFYIPAGNHLAEDEIARFDEAHSMLVSDLAPDRQKQFTLSNTGFYMLVLKLSIHFCRLHEAVSRREENKVVKLFPTDPTPV